MSISREEEQLLWTLLGLFGSLGLTIGLAQSDMVSRSLLLDAEALYKKRHSSYMYLWKKWIVEKEQHLLETNTNDVPLSLLTTKEEVQEFVQDQLLEAAGTNSAQILYIGFDSKDARAVREYMIWIVVASVGVYQCEVKLLGRVLSEHFDSQIATTTLCFVADASSGIGLDMVERVMSDHKASSALVRRPMWMMQLALIAAEGIISQSTLTQILASLCQLEAHWRKVPSVSLNGKANGSNGVTTHDVFRKTVVFTLPGQSVVPALLPLLHSAFPCERHVFLYDGCCASVDRAAKSSTTPIHEVQTSAVLSPLKSTLRTLPKALQALPLNDARTTECWMASVDAFFRLKQDNIWATEEYLPFVCRWDYLVEATTSVDPKKSLAILNLWQFMTGSRTRPLPTDCMDAARDVVADLATSSSPAGLAASFTRTRAIENCVFQHKRILIGNKTLLDTVQPEVEWSLKAATKRSGCSCCAPEEEEEEEMAVTSSTNTKTEFVSFLPNKRASSSRQRSSYVDGKTTFAFDPNKFA